MKFIELHTEVTDDVVSINPAYIVYMTPAKIFGKPSGTYIILANRTSITVTEDYKELLNTIQEIN